MTIRIKREGSRKGRRGLEERSEEPHKLGLVIKCVGERAQGVYCLGCF